MKQIVACLFGLMLGVAAASSATACTMLGASYQQQLGYQQVNWSYSDSIFLARARPVDGARSELIPLTTIHGTRPPRRSSVRVLTNCGDRPPDGVVIAFAERLSIADVQWRVWRLGEWVVSFIYPDEVVDPVLVSALREAADRLAGEAE